MTGNIKYVGIL